MNGDAKEWIDKAEGDYEGALVLAKHRSSRTAHLTCFACQQSAEKYLKAFLVERNVRFSKTHALVREILPLCEAMDAEFKVLAKYLKTLDPYAVEVRYPGEQRIEVSEIKVALHAAKMIRQFVRVRLGLDAQRSLL